MKTIYTAFLMFILMVGIVYANENDLNYFYKGSFDMYDSHIEDTVMQILKAQTDPETGLVKIGDHYFNFEYFANTLDEVDLMKVATLHFTDKDKNRYIIDYYFDGYKKLHKIMLFSKNGKAVNRELYNSDESSKKICRK